MARGRILRTKISLDLGIGKMANKLGVESALFFTWLIPHLDRDGRACGDARLLKAKVAPIVDAITPEKINAALAYLSEIGSVIVYVDGDTRSLQLNKFRSNQFSFEYSKEAASEYSDPKGCRILTAKEIMSDEPIERSAPPPKTEPAPPAQTELIPQEPAPAKPKPKPKTKRKPEETGPATPAARIVTEYKRLMAIESYDPRASYKLINGLIAAGVTESAILEVVAHSVKHPRTLPDGSPLTNLTTILSAGWFPQEQARAQASKPKPVTPEQQAKYDRAADMYANRFTRMLVRDGAIDAPEPQSDSFLRRHHGWDPTTETKDSALIRVRADLLERQRNGEEVYSAIDPPLGPPPSKDMCWRS